MKWFLPDAFDLVDPNFDFATEEHPPFRVRQRDDQYVHELLGYSPADGVLLSKGVIEGVHGSGGIYTMPQRHRLYRLGAKAFMRLPTKAELLVMGDCGAFSYVSDEEPPFTVTEVAEFYDNCDVDFGISVDHIVLAFRPDDAEPPEEAWVSRRKLTIELARDFLVERRSRGSRFEPVGVAQGWSPASIAQSVTELQDLGYLRIALGGMVPLKTPEILACLERVNEVRNPSTQLHLLGVTRCDHITSFGSYGVTSFDSTSPLLQAFKDEKDNYYALDRTYVAIRVPQVDANPKLKRQIQAGVISQAEARKLERTCLDLLVAFDKGCADIEEVLDALRTYELVYNPKRDSSASYRQALEDRPWSHCDCSICKDLGIQVILFRGSERNKRRGFHNLHVFRKRLDRELRSPAAHRRLEEATTTARRR